MSRTKRVTSKAPLPADPDGGNHHEKDKILVSAKRSPVERSGVHAWHPYYASYSEAFVESAAEYLDCSNDTLVLDPWGGGGTTGVVLARQGVPTLCADVNPVMATFAASKMPAVLKHEAEVLNLFDNLPAEPQEQGEHNAEDSLTAIFDTETARYIRAVVDAIDTPSFHGRMDKLLPRAVALACTDEVKLLHPVHSFCMAVIFVSLRKLSGTTTSANPTWLRTSEEKVHLEADVLHAELARNAARMLEDIRTFFAASDNPITNFAALADTRALPVKDALVDRVITSPPYLTRIDYAMSTMPEMYLFGDDMLLTAIRHQTMGAPVIRKGEKQQKEEWGELVNEALDSIKGHSTKAAASYYWKNIIQYFMDADAALDTILRVLKPGGKGLLVVQSSYFKEIELNLGDMYVQMAEGKGFAAKRTFREDVKGHMAHVNTKSSRYKSGKIYYEDFVLIEKP